MDDISRRLNIVKACDYLMGKTDKFIPKVLTDDPDIITKEKENISLDMVRFFVVDYMGWTPLEAVDHLTSELIECFGVKELFKYIVIDDNMRGIEKGKPIGDVTIKYILSKAFPESVVFDEEEGVIDVWDAVLSGELSKWPSKFFSDENGRMRRMVIIREFIRRYISVSERELYDEFKKSAEVNNLLRKARLFNVLSNYYVQPIDLLHDYLTHEKKQDEFTYVTYKYDNILPVTVSAMQW